MPERNYTNFKPEKLISTDFDRLIIDAKNMSILQWMSPVGSLPVSDLGAYVIDLQKALDKTYGRGHFWVYRHGHQISVQCRWPVDNS